MALAYIFATSAFAHDLWIVPGRSNIQPGETIRVFINSGDRFPTSDSLVNAARIESLAFYSASSKRMPITAFAADGKSLTAEITLSEPGVGALALALKPRLIRLKAEEFQQYLEEEGFPQLVKLREALGESDEPVVERYTKWAKALVSVGAERGEPWSEATGMRMEIVPQVGPNNLSLGDTMRVVILFEGKPLPNAAVIGGRAGTPAHRALMVTDSRGEASFVLKEAGRWYLRALHVTRLEDDLEADWESFWTTITFEVQG